MSKKSIGRYLPVKRRTVVKGTGAASIFGVTGVNQATADEHQDSDSAEETGTPRLFADLVVKNGKIVTMDDDGINSNPGTIAKAMAVRAGEILDLAENEEQIQKWNGPDTQVLDLQGRTVVPGIIDNHYHIHQMAWRVFDDEVPGLHTVGRAQREEGIGEIPPEQFANLTRSLVEESVSNLDANQWIVPRSARAFRPNGAEAIQDGHLTKDQLDELAPENPVLVEARPEILVNQQGLEWFQNNYGPAIDEGMLSFDSETGRMIEGSAVRTRRTAIGHGIFEDLDTLTSMLDKAQKEVLSKGFTTISTHVRQPPLLDGYAALDRNGDLDIRVGYSFANALDPLSPHVFRRYRAIHGIGSEKLFSAGAEAGFSDSLCTTASVPEDFGQRCSEPSSPEYEALKALSGRGLRVHGQHVAGDRQLDLFIDTIVEGAEEGGARMSVEEIPELRHSVDHGDMWPRPDQIPKIKEHNLGINLSMRRSWNAFEDLQEADVPEETLEKFHEWTVAAKTAIEGGVKPGWHGPDVTLQSSFFNLAGFVTREWNSAINDASTMEEYEQVKQRDSVEWVTLGPDQGVDRVTAMKMATIWNARNLLMEDQLGSLEVGKKADFVVLDQDWFSISEDKLKDVRTEITVVGGNIVSGDISC